MKILPLPMRFGETRTWIVKWSPRIQNTWLPGQCTCAGCGQTRTWAVCTILAKSHGTLSQKHRRFAHSPSTPNTVLIWRALHTQNHCRRFQHCLGETGGGQWPKQCDINRAADLRKAFFTNVQFCACFCRVSQGLLARLSEFGLVLKMIDLISVIHFNALFWIRYLLLWCYLLLVAPKKVI